jgi:threonine dehydrogenase-like Zn-dependent dehydrogenase
VLTVSTGQRYLTPLYDRVRNSDIDPSLGLDIAPDAYETFKHKQDECVKVVLKP